MVDIIKFENRIGTLSEILRTYIDKCYLLHGSIIDIKDKYLASSVIHSIKKTVYATDLRGVAIMKALILNKTKHYPGLIYPFIINDKTPLELKIYGFNKDTIKEEGWIYVINSSGFKNIPNNSIQYIKTSYFNFKVPIIAKIEVKREDLTIPIFDMDKNIRIQ